MQVFRAVLSFFAGAPAWVPLVLVPALLALAAAAFTLFGGRGAYRDTACALGGAGFFLLSAKGGMAESFAFLGLYLAEAAALRLLFFLPRLPVAKRNGAHKKRLTRAQRRQERAEKLYARFVAPCVPPARPLPPKECCFEEIERAPLSDAPQPSYAAKLLEKLQKEKLAPADRLEADALSRTVAGLGGRPLTEDEARILNDCLSSVLRLTAKYKL